MEIRRWEREGRWGEEGVGEEGEARGEEEEAYEWHVRLGRITSPDPLPRQQRHPHGPIDIRSPD